MALRYEDHLPQMSGLLRVTATRDIATLSGGTVTAGSSGILIDRPTDSSSVVAFDPTDTAAGVVLVVRDEDLDAVETGS